MHDVLNDQVKLFSDDTNLFLSGIDAATTTTTTTNVIDYSAAFTQLRGHFTKSRSKTDCTAQCRRLLTIGVDGATSAI